MRKIFQIAVIFLLPVQNLSCFTATTTGYFRHAPLWTSQAICPPPAFLPAAVPIKEVHHVVAEEARHELVAGRLIHRDEEFQGRFAANLQILRDHTSHDRRSKNAILRFVHPLFKPWMVSLAQELAAYEMTVAHMTPQVGDRIIFDSPTLDKPYSAFAVNTKVRQVDISISASFAKNDEHLSFSLISEIAHAIDFLGLNILGLVCSKWAIGTSGYYTVQKLAEVGDFLRRTFYGTLPLKRLSPAEKMLAGLLGYDMLRDPIHDVSRIAFERLYDAATVAIVDARLRESLWGFATLLNNFASIRRPHKAQEMNESQKVKLFSQISRSMMARLTLMGLKTDQEWLSRKDNIIQPIRDSLNLLRQDLVQMASGEGIYTSKPLSASDLNGVINNAMWNSLGIVETLAVAQTLVEVEEALGIPLTQIENGWPFSEGLIKQDLVSRYVDIDVQKVRTAADLIDALEFQVVSLTAKLTSNQERARQILAGIHADIQPTREFLALHSAA